MTLLRTLSDARVSYTAPSTGDGVRLMPSMYHEGSYAELERRLAQLRERGGRVWWHTCARYRWGVERPGVVETRRGSSGEVIVVVPPGCEVVATGASLSERFAVARLRRWTRGADERMALLGVIALVQSMFDGEYDRITVPPSVPLAEGQALPSLKTETIHPQLYTQRPRAGVLCT